MTRSCAVTFRLNNRSVNVQDNHQARITNQDVEGQLFLSNTLLSNDNDG